MTTAASCPILLINLAASAGRLAHAKAQLDAAGLVAERLEAVDGRLLPKEELARLAPHDPAKFFAPLTPGEVGCYLSHVAALDLLLARGWPRALVLEDDFVVAPDLARCLAELLALPGPPPDLVKLEGEAAAPRLVRTLAAGRSLVRYRRPPIRTVAQLWSAEGARKFLAVARVPRRPIDVQIKFWWEGDLEVQAVRPAPIWQDERMAGASTIGTRKTAGVSGWLAARRWRLRYALASRWHAFLRR